MQKCKVAEQTKTEWIIDQLYIQPQYRCNILRRNCCHSRKEKHSCCIPSIIYFDHLGEEKSGLVVSWKNWGERSSLIAFWLKAFFLQYFSVRFLSASPRLGNHANASFLLSSHTESFFFFGYFYFILSCCRSIFNWTFFELNTLPFTTYLEAFMCEYQKLKLFCTRRPRSHLITYPVNSTRGNSRVTYKNSSTSKERSRRDFLKVLSQAEI